MARKASQAMASVLLTFFSWSVFAGVNDAGIPVTWGYVGNKGPAYWAKLNPAFSLCATGKHQAPINIPANITPTTDNKLAIHYHPAPLQLVDKAMTELRPGMMQSIVRDNHGLQVNYHDKDARESVIFDGTDYRLVQFHFHSPSETELHQQSYPLEIHFVHEAADGKTLVLAVFVKVGASNPALQAIDDHLPKDDGEDADMSSWRFNILDLLPLKQNQYYSFAGSLTTPPCAEGVQWVVLADTITASPGQIVILRKAMGGNNIRPVQPLNNRDILYVEGKP